MSVFGTDFNKVILEPNPELEGRILKVAFPDVRCRPVKCTRKAFEDKGQSPEMFELVRDMIYLPAYRNELKPVDGAFETLKSLIERGYAIRVVTSRTGLSCRLAEQWFYEKSGLADVEFIGVGMDEDGKKKCKVEALLDARVRIYIDNSVRKFEQIIAQKERFAPLPELLHLRRNGGKPGSFTPPYVHPVHSWGHVLNIVDSMVTV